MARPIKTGLDYFPLDINLDSKIELFEAEYGLQGFGFIIKIFQKIYKNGYYIKWDEDELSLTSKQVNVSNNSINAYIKTAIKRDIFDKNLYERYGILTSKGIQKRFFLIVNRRKKIEIKKEYILIELKDYKNVNVSNNSINVSNNSVNADIMHAKTELLSTLSAQSKVKESKLKESKVNERKEEDFLSEVSRVVSYSILSSKLRARERNQEEETKETTSLTLTKQEKEREKEGIEVNIGPQQETENIGIQNKFFSQNANAGFQKNISSQQEAKDISLKSQTSRVLDEIIKLTHDTKSTDFWLKMIAKLGVDRVKGILYEFSETLKNHGNTISNYGAYFARMLKEIANGDDG
ncbi:MAG: DUF4373 domain-containing protein [Elusimicrobiota bacterium]|jgi:hypothetical protein|nr:DUF4373 domain-containing protein [Elusimicrobiota bacterium]